MKKTSWITQISIIAIICLVLMIIFVRYSTSQSPAKLTKSISVTRPANCVPLPWLNKITATILPGSRQYLETPGLIKTIPTVSQHQIANTFDLRPDLPQSSKLMVFVFRCDGTEDLYLIDPQAYNTGNAIPLDHGDVISGVTSPSELYYHGPPPTRTNPYPNTSTSTPSAPKVFTAAPFTELTKTLQPSTAPYPGPGISTPRPGATTSPYPPPTAGMIEYPSVPFPESEVVIKIAWGRM
jgi:hypothetical protein